MRQGTLLRTFRLRALLSQEELAQRAGLSVRAIRNLEAGRASARPASLALLADALEISDEERCALGMSAQAPASTPANRDSTPRPAQLPLDVGTFTGRMESVAWLNKVAGEQSIAVISGMGGVGKTALAVHWAHQARDLFPDGQLYVNLHGFSAQGPVTSYEALSQFLRSLGIAAERIPVELPEASAFYRSLLADNRMLVVLDNALDAAHVRPLLPGGSGCLALVTSRDSLTGLAAKDGAWRMVLHPLDPEEAIVLLGRIIGRDRAWQEPEATVDLVRACAYLPLAVRIAAASLADDSDLSIAAYASRLAEDRLSALEIENDDEAALRTAFAQSYGRLGPCSRRLFRLFSTLPGSDVDVEGAAALAALSVDRTRTLLDELIAAHLIEQPRQGRFSCHDLLRDFAREQSATVDTASERRTALTGLLRWYLCGSNSAALLAYPEKLRMPMPAMESVDFADRAEAVAWLDSERANLVAAVQAASRHGHAELGWLLADTLRGYFWLRRHLRDWQQVAEAAVDAAFAEHDLTAQAAAMNNMATLHWSCGRYPEAIEAFTSAATLAEKVGWTAGEGGALGNLGVLLMHSGQTDRAYDCYLRAIVLDRSAGRLAGEATNLNNLGTLCQETGRFDEAVEHYTRALSLHQSYGSRPGEISARHNLAGVFRQLGRLDQALQLYTENLTPIHEVGDRRNLALTHTDRAATLRDMGMHADGLADVQRGLMVAREIGDQRCEATSHIVLASIHLGLKQPREAVDHYQEGHELARRSGDTDYQAEALAGLARARHRLGDTARAICDAQNALAMTQASGHARLETEAQGLLEELRRTRPSS